MTERTSTPARETIADRLDRTLPALSPEVRSIAFDALEPVDRSFPVALCRASAGAVSSDGPSARTLESIALVVEPLQGYVRLRNDLLAADRYESAAERDAAILAGDYLHAFAHASIGDASPADGGRLELFRVLTDASNALASAYATSEGDSGSDTTPVSDPSRTSRPDRPAGDAPTAILAGAAAELGAAAAGATETVRESARAYGASLSRALSIAERGSVDTRDESPRWVATRVLSARSFDDDTDEPPLSASECALDGPVGNRDGSLEAGDRSAVLEDELESARSALETIETVDPIDRGPATADGEDSPAVDDPARSAQGSSDRHSDDIHQSELAPRTRLERAAHLPFQGLLAADE
ncbi:hypothetical protein [Halostagnicola kamekurae]|uniref:Polyprenyl synthetase n=1 Tax=Halostagnicola kamekurae TaxID=619731 RepID=A0A1I6PZB2_9EURY|nr:hypothetical protein [Halostagnicola kamekurae]SFS45502.1 hypothetical protein SAMN04488556_0882 [Halostagnicola kamekurae]